jgi:hypothetical protein
MFASPHAPACISKLKVDVIIPNQPSVNFVDNILHV